MRRGFTLVEMLVAMVVVGIVGAALIRLLSNQQRLSVTQVEQAMLQSNVGSALRCWPASCRRWEATSTRWIW
jgi:prepilin-type N-terminal cleavage/methylation domain-containing protein